MDNSTLKWLFLTNSKKIHRCSYIPLYGTKNENKRLLETNREGLIRHNEEADIGVRPGWPLVVRGERCHLHPTTFAFQERGRITTRPLFDHLGHDLVARFLVPWVPRAEMANEICGRCILVVDLGTMIFLGCNAQLANCRSPSA